MLHHICVFLQTLTYVQNFWEIVCTGDALTWQIPHNLHGARFVAPRNEVSIHLHNCATWYVVLILAISAPKVVDSLTIRAGMRLFAPSFSCVYYLQMRSIWAILGCSYTYYQEQSVSIVNIMSI